MSGFIRLGGFIIPLDNIAFVSPPEDGDKDENHKAYIGYKIGKEYGGIHCKHTVDEIHTMIRHATPNYETHMETLAVAVEALVECMEKSK